MIYKWLEKGLTADQVSKEIDAKVKSITIGGVANGDDVENGIFIETDETLTDKQLQKLDLLFTGLKRKGGISIVDKISELETKINKGA